jgi:hypothetical protein
MWERNSSIFDQLSFHAALIVQSLKQWVFESLTPFFQKLIASESIAIWWDRHTMRMFGLQLIKKLDRWKSILIRFNENYEVFLSNSLVLGHVSINISIQSRISSQLILNANINRADTLSERSNAREGRYRKVI